MGRLQEPVGQGRFTVVDVRNNAKIPDLIHGCAKVMKRADSCG
jgi:hypothetical protein